MKKKLAIFKGNRKKFIFSILLLITIFQGISCLSEIIQIQSEPGSRVLLGLSWQRLLVFGMALLLTLFAIIILVYSSKTLVIFANLRNNKLFREGLFTSLIFLIWIGFVDGHNFGGYMAFYIRIHSFIKFIGLTVLNLNLYYLYIDYFFKDNEIEYQIPQYFPLFSRIFLPLLVGLVIVSKTKFGIAPLDDHWGETGAIFYGYQLIAVLLIASYGRIFYRLLIKKFPNTNFKIDYAIVVLLWITAAFFWVHESFPNNYFFPSVPSLGTERYPYSDAAVYDTFANSILIGNGFDNPRFTYRPFYVIFLSLLHFLGKGSYSSIINLQTIILAISIPLLYFIGKELHSKFLGVFISVSCMLLEINLIKATKFIQVANSKILITEPITGLLIILITLLFILSIKRGNKLIGYACAGIFGLSLLVRLHTAMIILPILFVLYIYSLKRFVPWVKSIFPYIVIPLLLIIPWMTRNYMVVGQFSPDPNRLSLIIDVRWGDSFLDDNLGGGKNNSPNNYSSFGGGYIEIENDLQYYLKSIVGHFIHNEFLDLLSLPITYNYQSSNSYFENSFKFWKGWTGKLDTYESIMVIINLAFVSLGIAYSWKKHHLVGVIPLLFQISYITSNSLVRTSGWRYLKPVEWVKIIYFGIGVVIIFEWLSRFLTGVRATNKLIPSNNQPLENPSGENFFLKQLFYSSVLWLSIGLIISFGPKAIPFRYDDQFVSKSRPIILKEVAAKTGVSIKELNANLISEKNSVFEIGKMLYPRYFKNFGVSSPIDAPFHGLRYPRYEITILNEKENLVVLPSDIYKPLPHGVDVAVIGCYKERYIDAFAIIILGDESEVISRAPIESFKCPLISK
ncbi:MAG: hypothetical protein OEZ01_10660 [Candidatus Heimdallarchaeota archaeon]|nr:hypothetical protein [Candidatus Heimdallarchaeota archaeon]